MLPQLDTLIGAPPLAPGWALHLSWQLADTLAAAHAAASGTGT
jgi:hypothetical protein